MSEKDHCIQPDSHSPLHTLGNESPSADSFVETREICKKYTTSEGDILHAARDVSLSIAHGQSVALVGPSGSGKSTLLHLIGLIDTPDSGSITVDGRVITDLRGKDRADYRSRVGFVFQQFHLIDSLTVAQNVAAPLIGRTPRGKHAERVKTALDLVGLASRADAYPSQLSGGQQQRVAIARALAVEPALILADEPTGNLDSANSQKIADLLLELHTAKNITLILATHDLALAARMERVIEIHDGVATEALPSGRR